MKKLTISESGLFIFLKLFVGHSSGENHQNEEKQLTVWVFIV